MMTKAIKLIAIDLDGTLLQSDGSVSERTKAAIAAARAKGVVVSIATGRMYQTASPYGRLLAMGDAPMMLYAGGLIQTLQTRRKLFEHPVKLEDAQAVVDLCKEKGWYIQTYIDDVLRVSSYDKWAKGYEEKTRSKAVFCGDDFWTLQGAPNKLLMRGEPDIMLERRRYLEDAFPGKFTIVFSMPTFMEIMPKGISKAVGLTKMGEIYGIGNDEIMALGDSENDLDMINAAGFSVAMANSTDAVKAAADCLTASNDDDGVAKAIEKYVL